MERIQFYPPEILKRVMLQDAKINGISISQLTVDILMEHYGLAVATENKKALSEIIDEVIDEVKTFVKDHPSGTTFDLLTASETFKNIHMVADGKPSTNRATVGKIFASKLGKDSFKNIVIVRTETGAIKRSPNRATLYRIL
ncbi:hypothetical protein [Roseburia inulinivorans]|jgi:hypothetical protein|uniref:Uncharacterized protein n=1 Tax=Roseburia inulinivorans TaxID=360807 RepID=A0A412FC55_9FIRM|nr:hypothetical protein [Roseburia inulinivorans]RGR65364.1 hypothetical protein DWY29_15025 [Roseburia inulinivorans]